MVKINSFEISIKNFFKELKNSKKPLIVDILSDQGKKIGFLEFVNRNISKEAQIIKSFAKWRQNSEWFFPSQFKVTVAGTRIWAEKALMDKEDRVLFLIRDIDKKLIGHIGLYSFNFKNKTCEIDNVIRGEIGAPGIMTYALKSLIMWTFDNLKIKNLYLRVFNDNDKAIALYERCNFSQESLIPLKKRIEGNTTYWDENVKDKKGERYFLKMKYVI